MTTIKTILHSILNASPRGWAQAWRLSSLAGMLCGLACIFFTSCDPEPPLHLYDEQVPVNIKIPIIDLDLEVYWDYELEYGVHYEWGHEWVYGWDEEDARIFGDEIGYTEPTTFFLRRYYTFNTPYSPHTSVLPSVVEGNYFRGEYEWGFWDILVWSDVKTKDDVQSLIIDEVSSLDSVTATTNLSMRAIRHYAPTAMRAAYQPEQLFSAYDQAIEINESLEGFVYDPERNVYVKKLDMVLEPVTYIYLTQVILHNNRGRVTGVDGVADFSGMARGTNVNTGIPGWVPGTVDYDVRFKPHVTLPETAKPYMEVKEPNEDVAVAGGRLLTFGICGQNGNRVHHLNDVKDPFPHYMDVNFQFYNGMDSTIVFPITDKVHQRWKGGVITVELDMDTVPIPRRSGGSAFDAVVEDYEEEEYEIEM